MATDHPPFEKARTENYLIEYDYSAELAKFDPAPTISSSTWECIDLSTGQNDNALLDSTTGTVDGSLVNARAVHNQGTIGKKYLISQLAVFSNGERRMENVVMTIATKKKGT